VQRQHHSYYQKSQDSTGFKNLKIKRTSTHQPPPQENTEIEEIKIGDIQEEKSDYHSSKDDV
jgi:hypothetical protein